MKGVLVIMIPFERLIDSATVLGSHFTALNIFRMTDLQSAQFRQIAILGVRHDVRGAALEKNKRRIQNIGLNGSFQQLPELQPDICQPYSVPQSGEATLTYRGLPYDLFEDLLPHSPEWKQLTPLLLPNGDVARGGRSHRCMVAPRGLALYRRSAQMASSASERTGTSLAGAQ